MNKPDKQKPEVPRLPDDVKKLNGKSGKRLAQCIDNLCDVMDEPVKKDIPNS